MIISMNYDVITWKINGWSYKKVKMDRVNWETTRWSGYDDYLSDWESVIGQYDDFEDEDENEYDDIYDWMWR